MKFQKNYHYSVNKPSIKLHMSIYYEIQTVMVPYYREEVP